MEQQKVEMLAPVMEPPKGFLEALWPALEPALEPALILAMLMTIAITHVVKQISVFLDTRLDDSIELWRTFCTAASVVVGLSVGTVVWTMGYFGWLAIPITAFGSGPAWRLLMALAPNKLAEIFMTDSDMKFRKRSE